MKYNNKLARQLILYVVLASTLITILTTAYQLYGMYSRDMSQIDERLREIQDVHLQNIATRLWIADKQELEKTLQNLLGLPDIEYIEVREGDKVVMRVGTFRLKNTIVKTYPLQYQYRGKQIIIGQLLLHASLDNVYHRLFDQTLSILLSNAIKTFIVSGFMLFIFFHLVTRHLYKLSTFARNLDHANLHQTLQLDRKPSRGKEPDELEAVVNAFVTMQGNLKQSFDKLKNSEQHYRSLIESSAAIPWEADAETFRFTYVGPQAQIILGYSLDDWYEADFWRDHIHPEDRDFTCNYCLDSVKTCSDHEFEYRMLAADGREVWLRNVVQVICENGKPVRMQGFMFDICEQKMATEAYSTSEQRFSTLAEISTVGIFRTDLMGNCIYVNQRWCDLAGLLPAQAMGDGWAAAIHPEDRQRVFTEWQQAAQTENTFQIECRLLRPDGHESWVLSMAAAEKDSNGKTIGYIGTVTDISAQKHIETAIRYIARGTSSDTGEAFYRQLVTHMARLFDADFAMLAVLDENDPETANTLALICKGELIDNISYTLPGTPCETIITSQTCSYTSNIQQHFPEDTLLIDMDIESYVGTSVTNTHGEPIGLIAIMHSKPLELSEQTSEILQIFATRASAEIERQQALLHLEHSRDQLEDQIQERTQDLQAINRELEAFSYSVSHDLRAPLRAIDGFSLALLEDYQHTLDETAQRYLQRIRHNTSYMNDLIESMLNLSRLGRKKLKPEPIQLETTARQILDNLIALQADRKISYTIGKLPPLIADANLIRIVMENLLGNALKYTKLEEQTEIEVNCMDIKGESVFFVRDNGTGFDMQFADNLFAAFQRLHGDEFEGTGIGLATVQRIIHRHGGRIWAEAELGKGATFYFTLPVQNQKPELLS